MPIKYKIDVLAALKEKGYPTTRLRKEKLIGEATIQRLRHKQSVSFDVLSKLCDLLVCDIGDLLIHESKLLKSQSGDILEYEEEQEEAAEEDIKETNEEEGKENA